MKREVYEVDMSNQIDNPWDDDTVLSIVGDNISSSVRIKAEQKGQLKGGFYHDIPKKKRIRHEFKQEQNANAIVSTVIHAYLIHKLLSINPNVRGMVIVCPDSRPVIKVYQNYQRACVHFNSGLNSRVNISFRKSKWVNKRLVRAAKSKADRTARKVLRNKRARCYHITETDMLELEGFIRSNYHRQKFKRK